MQTCSVLGTGNAPSLPSWNGPLRATVRPSERLPWAQMVKRLPVVQEPWARSLHQEAPLEKGLATHSSIPAWRIPWTEEPGGLLSIGSQRVGNNWATNTHTIIRETNEEAPKIPGTTKLHRAREVCSGEISTPREVSLKDTKQLLKPG